MFCSCFASRVDGLSCIVFSFVDRTLSSPFLRGLIWWLFQHFCSSISLLKLCYLIVRLIWIFFFFLFLYSSHLDLITISDGCSNLAFRCRNTWLDCSINF